MTTFATIDALRESLAMPAAKTHSPEYVAKMLHEVPEADVVDRAAFIMERCRGHVVLDIGASGLLHDQIKSVAKKVYGIDREDGDDIAGIDLSHYATRLPKYQDVTRVVCGEVLEHLSNPGIFLEKLRLVYGGTPTIVTVPNAFSRAGHRRLLDGVENVNIDHVAWYSHRTLKTLLSRYGYEIKEFYWYNGEPLTAEGLVVVTE